jgi:phage terminase large subunit
MNKEQLKLIIESYINEHGIDTTQKDINSILKTKILRKGRPKNSNSYNHMTLMLYVHFACKEQIVFGEEIILPKNWVQITVDFLQREKVGFDKIFKKSRPITSDEALKKFLRRLNKKMQTEYSIFMQSIKNEASKNDLTIDEFLESLNYIDGQKLL